MEYTAYLRQWIHEAYEDHTLPITTSGVIVAAKLDGLPERKQRQIVTKVLFVMECMGELRRTGNKWHWMV